MPASFTFQLPLDPPNSRKGHRSLAVLCILLQGDRVLLYASPTQVQDIVCFGRTRRRHENEAVVDGLQEQARARSPRAYHRDVPGMRSFLLDRPHYRRKRKDRVF